MPRPLSVTRTPPLSSRVTTMVSQYPASASSTELSTTSWTRWCRPRSPVEPMYIPGRLRTASRPSSTVIDDALYSLLFSVTGVVSPSSDPSGPARSSQCTWPPSLACGKDTPEFVTDGRNRFESTLDVSGSVWMRSRGIQPSIAQPGSAVRVTRAAAGDVPGSLTPAGGGRTLDPHALDHAVSDALRDLRDQLALQQPELGRPRGGARLNGELAVLQRDRLRVFGDVLTDELGPLAEHAPRVEPLHPATVGDQPGRQPAERLRVTCVGSGP